MRHSHSRLAGQSRRRFIESIARTALGVSVVPVSETLFGSAAQAAVAAAPGNKAEHVIYLMMNGAMSHIDTFDPKPDKEEGGETKAIQTSVPGLKIAEHLPTLASKMDQLAVIRSMTTETGAHEQGRYLMRTSYKKIGTIRHPFLGSWLTHFEGKINKDLPGSVIVGGGSRHPQPGLSFCTGRPRPCRQSGNGVCRTRSRRST